MKKSVAIIVMLLVLFVFSCKHEPLGSLPDPTPVPPGPNEVCFQTEILPIFQSNCAKSGCHDAISRKEGYVLDNYANIISKGIIPGNAGNSKVYKSIIDTDPGDRMPEPPNPPLTSVQIALIAKWINEGAKNTTCAATCDPNVFTYSGAVKKIMDTYCVGCHGITNPSGNISLVTYDQVRVVALNGKLYGSVSWQAGYSAMPKNASKLSDCQLQQIQKWINAGALNN